MSKSATPVVYVLFGAAGVANAVLAWLWSVGEPGWLRGLAVTLALAMFVLALAVYGSFFEHLGPLQQRLVYALLWALWIATAFLPERTSWAPGWLREGWVHAGLAASALAYVALWALWLVLGAVPAGLVVAVIARRVRRRLPDEHLIDGLTDFFVNMPKPGTVDTLAVRRKTLRQLEKVALDFERWWPRRVRTGYSLVDGKAHDWARRVGTRVRGEQLALLTGQRNRADLGQSLGKVIADLVLGNALEPAEDVDVAIERSTWLRRVRRVVASAGLLVLGLGLLLVAAWQPGLPEVLAQTGLTDVAKALTWGDELRAGALAGAFTTLSIFARLVAPDTTYAYPVPFAGLRIHK